MAVAILGRLPVPTNTYKGGTLYFYWGSAVWEKYKCSINGNKIVINDDGKSVVYYKQ